MMRVALKDIILMKTFTPESKYLRRQLNHMLRV
jgi:hypothetical protein